MATIPLRLRAGFRADIPTSGVYSGFGLNEYGAWTNSIQFSNLAKIQQLTPFTRVAGTEHRGVPFPIDPNKYYVADIVWFRSATGEPLATFSINGQTLGTLPAPMVDLEVFVQEAPGHTMQVEWLPVLPSAELIAGGIITILAVVGALLYANHVGWI